MKKFRLCSYWGTWNRILTVSRVGIVELDLTPVNWGNSSGKWANTKLEVLRVHGTSTKDDKEYDELPAQVREIMVRHYGETLTERMLTFDYLAEVSPEQIRSALDKSNGGGVPLFAIKEILSGQRSFWTNR